MNLLAKCIISKEKKQVNDIGRISRKMLAPRPDAFSDDGFCSPEHGRIAKNL